MGCMKPFDKHIRWNRVGLAAVLLIVCACAKDYAGDIEDLYLNQKDVLSSDGDLAIGTIRSRDGVRYIKLDEKTCSQVMNPGTVKDIPDNTRISVEFRYVLSAQVADFCTDAILVEWASPIDQGEIRYDMQASVGDPVDLILDWITCLEDGFLTLHYSIPTKGKTRHSFSLYPSVVPNEYRLVHDAHGDVAGELTEGIVCFDISPLLPETGEETVELNYVYIDLNHTEKRLTVDYRSPK